MKTRSKLFSWGGVGLSCIWFSLFGVSLAHAVPPQNAPLNQNLACGSPLDINSVLPVTHTVSLAGTGFAVEFGLNNNYGGVISKFKLSKLGSGGGSADVIEARSTAGGGIQSGYSIYPYSPAGTSILFNQGVGNSLGRQWGFGSTLISGSSPTSNYVNSSDWTPIYNDTYSSPSGTAGVSPCEPPNQYTNIFDDGALDFATAQVSTNAGTAVLMTHQYSWRSRVNQYWKLQYHYHALYLSRSVARMGNLRMYVHYPSGVDGPIYPHDSMASPTNAHTFCGNSTVVYCTHSSSDYIVLVWNIFGTDIGVVVQMTGGGAQLRLEKNKPYCADSNNDSCGEIDIQVVSPNNIDAVFLQSSIRSYPVNYRIGTIPQLEALGFFIH